MSLGRRHEPLAAGAAAAIALLAPMIIGNAPAALAARPYKPPKLRHVFVIVLENEDYESTFGDPEADPYLAQTLPAQGALLEDYYATGHESNDNYIALVSGQPPNPDNQADCQLFSDFLGASTLPDGVEEGIGCVYPAAIENIGTQLSAPGASGRPTRQDMGNDPNREAAACGHPALNGVDETQKAEAGDGYATRHDPFVYFHSVIDDQAYCDAARGRARDAGGRDAGGGAEAARRGSRPISRRPERRRPSRSSRPTSATTATTIPCTNQPSGASALADIDGFLETWVPKITSSPAFARRAACSRSPSTSPTVPNRTPPRAAKRCPVPDSPLPGISGPGGGRSAQCCSPRSSSRAPSSTTPYNHYSSLASWETLLGLPPLADAASAPAIFGPDVFTAAK